MQQRGWNRNNIQCIFTLYYLLYIQSEKSYDKLENTWWHDSSQKWVIWQEYTMNLFNLFFTSKSESPFYHNFLTLRQKDEKHNRTFKTEDIFKQINISLHNFSNLWEEKKMTSSQQTWTPCDKMPVFCDAKNDTMVSHLKRFPPIWFLSCTTPRFLCTELLWCDWLSHS